MRKTRWFVTLHNFQRDPTFSFIYYEGLVSNINSSLWRHGSADKYIPLLDDKTTYIFTNQGNVTWAGIDPNCTVNRCQSENYNHISWTPIYDTDFCECHLCNIDFWRPYKSLFSSEGHSPADLDIDANINRLQKMPWASPQKSKLGPHKVEVCDSNFLPSHPSDPSELNQDISGTAMTAKLPRIFDTFAHRAFKAGEQPDGLQVSAQWVTLIGGLPMLSDRFHFHLFGQRERCLEMILSSVARVVLCLLTAWPTSLSPMIDHTRMYYKEEIWNPYGQHLENMLWRKVDIDKVEHIKCNQRKFPVQLLR